VPVGPRALLAPRMWGLHALAAAAVAAATLLGLWQFDAWQTTRHVQAESLADAEPVPLSSVMSSDDAFPGDAVGQPVELAGRWVPQSTMYVADRRLDGQDGVWAVTPVAVCSATADCAAAPAMLVVRGWASSPAQAPAPPTGAVEVTGWLQPGEGSGLSDPDPDDDVIPEMRIADAIQHVDQDVYGGYVVARDVSSAGNSATVEDGLEPVTPASLPEVDAFTALRNLLYAVEWWVFGGFAVFLWLRWCRDEVERARVADAAGDGAEPPLDRAEESPSDAPVKLPDERSAEPSAGHPPGQSSTDGVSGVTGVPSGP
jgi:surfeit locus 1 family protein